jgi:hypothetical protein
MQTVTIRQKTGTDGILRLTIPVGIADAECEVVVVLQPQAVEERGWLPDFFKRIGQGWQGERLERPPQGEYEKREPLR